MGERKSMDPVRFPDAPDVSGISDGSDISDTLNIPEESMGSMEKNDPAGFRMMMGILNGICPNCGGPVKSNRLGRPRKFCSERCRSAWNHRHTHPERWKDTGREVVCPVCGKVFTATREYGRLRKYCSRACANKGRAGKGQVRKETESG